MDALSGLVDDVAAHRPPDFDAALREGSVRPPRLVWSPRERDLPARPLAQLVAQWRALRQRADLPRWADFVPEAWRSWRHWYVLVEADARAAAHPDRPASNLRRLDPTGRDGCPPAQPEAAPMEPASAPPGWAATQPLPEELSATGSTPADASLDPRANECGEGVPAPWVERFHDAVFAAVSRRREALFTEHRTAELPFVTQWSRVVLPFADDEGRVVRFLVGIVPETPFRSLLDTVQDGILMLDGAGTVQLANRRAAEMFDCGESEMLGRPIRGLVDLPCPGETPTAELGVPLRETEARRPDGSRFPVEISIGSAPCGSQDFAAAVLRDITARKRAEAEMRKLAFTDPLTGLANRTVFQDRLRDAIARSRRQRTRTALMFLDLDRFKAVNDQHGHPAGDVVLRELADRLGPAVRETDLVARLGGDEFAILQTDVLDLGGVRTLLARLLRYLRPPVAWRDLRLPLSVSIGVAIFPDHATSIEGLIERADAALYRAKRGRRVAFASAAQRAHVEAGDRAVMEAALHEVS